MAAASPPGRFPIRLALLVLLAAALLAGAWMAQGGAPAVRSPGAAAPRVIGLFTSLPILWRETGALSDLLAMDGREHFARGVFAAHGRLKPLDTLAGKHGRLPLPPHAVLVMAQPRPLSPAENVALDAWVRAGGRVLLFADPMLTAHSAYPLGDKRRPQDVVLLSPILARWGLELQFDDDQPGGEREIPLFGGVMPIDLAGRFVFARTARCRGEAGGLAVECRTGSGEILAIADAALLDGEGGGDDREAMLASLLQRLDHGI